MKPAVRYRWRLAGECAEWFGHSIQRSRTIDSGQGRSSGPLWDRTQRIVDNLRILAPVFLVCLWNLRTQIRRWGIGLGIGCIGYSGRHHAVPRNVENDDQYPFDTSFGIQYMALQAENLQIVYNLANKSRDKAIVNFDHS